MRREREERIGLGWGWRISHSLQTQTDRHRRTRTGNQVGRQLGEGERWETGSRLGWAREKRRRTTALCGCGVWKLWGKKKGEGHGLTDWLTGSFCLSVRPSVRLSPSLPCLLLLQPAYLPVSVVSGSFVVPATRLPSVFYTQDAFLLYTYPSSNRLSLYAHLHISTFIIVSILGLCIRVLFARVKETRCLAEMREKAWAEQWIWDGFNWLFVVCFFFYKNGRKLNNDCLLAESIHGACDFWQDIVENGFFSKRSFVYAEMLMSEKY